MKTYLLGRRKPTKAESLKGIEIVFIREDESGRQIEIFGARCYESFEQWGAPIKILGENVEAIEAWRAGE